MWSNWMAMDWVVICFMDIMVYCMNWNIVVIVFMFMNVFFWLWMECWRKSHWMMMVSSPLFFEDISFVIMTSWVDEVWT